MSHNKNYRRGKKQQYSKNKTEKNTEFVLDESNPILCSFRQYAIELDDKHDRYERIVKISRDITIESKKIIFLLHTLDWRKDSCQKILDEAKQRLMNLCTNNFISIAKELEGLDPYQYTRGYSAGLQEFIEAFSFYECINGTTISDWEFLQKHLTYEVNDNEKTEENTTDDMKEQNEEIEKQLVEPTATTTTKILMCLIQPNEYMLGIADMSGEVMRRAINSLGSGNLSVCFKSNQLMQQLYSGYLKIGVTFNREFQRKISTLRQSLLKTESVCYNIKVRGGEAAKWIPESESKLEGDDDEGFYG